MWGHVEKVTFLPFAVLHMALFPKHPRRCLRSGQGVPPFLGGIDTWRLLSVLPTPHEDVHDDQGPHDPNTQSMAARKAGRQRDQLRVLNKRQEKKS